MLTIKSVRNVVYGDLSKTYFNAEVTFEERGDIVYPFSAMADDVEAHGRELYARIAAGEFGPIGEYVPPSQPVAPDQPTTSGAQTL